MDDHAGQPRDTALAGSASQRTGGGRGDGLILNIALFSNQFAGSKGFGLARYARELHGALSVRPGLNVVPVAAWSDRADPSETGAVLLPTGRRGTSLAWTFLGAPALERLTSFTPDVVHAASLGYPVATKKPFVVTVHDLGPLTHRAFFRKARPFVMRRALAQAARADAVVCVSAFAREEFLRVAGEGVRPRTHVVSEGAAPLPPADHDGFAALGLTKPFVLAVGQASPRKNFDGLVAALARLGDAVPHHLVVAGGTGWDAGAFDAAIRDHHMADRVHKTGFVSDGVLAALYARASAFALPSFYEGFGLPVLEAMAAGVPVIASNVSALPEVAGDAALLVDPSDTKALAGALHAVLTNETLAGDMRDKGRARAKNFSFAAAAAAMEQIYRAIS